MNGHLKAHGKHMIIGGVGIMALMMVLGAGWQQALTWGLLLACPLGMIGMMWFMGRRDSGGHQHSGHEEGDEASWHAHGSEGPQQRVSAAFVPGRPPAK